MKETLNVFAAEGGTGVVCGTADPACLIILPVAEGGEDPVRVAEETAARCDVPFLLAAFPVGDWNRDLSPWPAPPVFGREAFAGGAEETLRRLTEQFLPAVRQRFPGTEHLPVILGGYSLAGLFALWSACRTDVFAAAAGVSPSVWFPGWAEYAASRRPRTGCVYLSLGDREERTRNPVMAAVGDNIRAYSKRLKAEKIPSVLVWNEGNHFRDPDVRCAKGLAWCLEQISCRV